MTLLSILTTLGLGGAATQTSSKVLTGASGTLTAMHRDRSTGEVHQHIWEITVWVTAWQMQKQQDAKSVQRHLDKWTSNYSGKCLPDRIAWAEDMATHIADHFSIDIGREVYCPLFEVRAVEISREKEGLKALWLSQ